MRRLLVAGFIAVATQSAAFAADLPILRGALHEPAPACCQTVWQGFYVGGQAGYGSSSMDALRVQSGADLERDMAVPLGRRPTGPSMFGAFAGYNAQYENVVLGFEGNYMHGNVHRRRRPAVTHLMDESGQYIPHPVGSMTVKDFGSIRVRGGYTMGSFMPYALRRRRALGRADTASKHRR